MKTVFQNRHNVSQNVLFLMLLEKRVFLLKHPEMEKQVLRVELVGYITVANW